MQSVAVQQDVENQNQKQNTLLGEVIGFKPDNFEDDLVNKVDKAIQKLDRLDVDRLNTTMGKIDQMCQMMPKTQGRTVGQAQTTDMFGGVMKFVMDNALIIIGGVLVWYFFIKDK